MARLLPIITERHVIEVRTYSKKRAKSKNLRKRLEIIKLLSRIDLNDREIAQRVGVCRQTVAKCRKELARADPRWAVSTVMRLKNKGRKPVVSPELAQDLFNELIAGNLRSVDHVRDWIHNKTGKILSVSGTRKVMKRTLAMKTRFYKSTLDLVRLKIWSLEWKNERLTSQLEEAERKLRGLISSQPPS